MDTGIPLAFKSHILAHVVDEKRVLLLTEASGTTLLRGALYSALTPLLDGSRTADQIVDALKAHWPAADVYFALMRLERQGHIASVVTGLSSDATAFWQALGGDAGEAQSNLTRTSVAVVALGNTAGDAAALSATLADAGLAVADTIPAELVVAVVDDYLRPELADLNRRQLAAGTPWLVVKPVGRVLWLGPFFGADDVGCWCCLARRLQENRASAMAVEARGQGHPVLSRGALATTRALAINLAATQIATWAALKRDTVLRHSVLTIDLQTLQARQHRVHRLPDCNACGSPAPDDIAGPGMSQVKLRNGHKLFTADGGHRTCRPEETFARLEPFISPISGIVPDLLKAGMTNDIHVYHVQQTIPLDATGRSTARLGDRMGACGKGSTDVQARVSCLAEAVERYSCFFRGNEPRLEARLSDLGSNAIHPHVLLNFSARQYATRDASNKNPHDFNWVPLPFDENRKIEWTPNWSLTREEIRWLPTAYCYFGYPVDCPGAFCQSDSNGCASGNSLEEAILQGFLELVERDAMALWWYNRPRRPAVDLDSFDDPFFNDMAGYHRKLTRTLEVVDLTTDLNIPVVAALSWDAAGGAILIGLGAHLDPRIAISRALNEVNQVMTSLTFHERANTESVSVDKPHFHQWLRHATIENQPHVVPNGTRLTVDRFPKLQKDDLLGDISTCLEIIRQQGMEMIVLDLTRPDVAFPTVRVTVPGLCHFWPRFGPGRLYDIPVGLGWIDRKLDETELNPIPFFM